MRREGLKEKKLIAANQNFKAEEFWRNRLSGQVPKSQFPYCYHCGPLPRSSLGKADFSLEGEPFNRLMEQCRHSDYKLHLLLTVTLALLVRFYSYPPPPDLLLGTPIYNPGQEDDFVNTLLPLRIEVDKDPGVKEILTRTGKQIAAAAENQNFPMEILFERLGLPVTPGGRPLLDVIVILKNLQDPRHLEGIYYSTLFSFTRQANGLEGELHYRTDLYDRALAENITRHYIHLLEQIVPDLDIEVSQLQVMPEIEKIRRLQDFNRPSAGSLNSKHQAGGYSVQRLFQQQAAMNPEKIAITEQNRQISYHALDQKANRLAGILVSRGVKPGTLVAAAVEPCIEAIVGMMAIFKAGAVYLPVSPVGPTESNAKIIAENRVNLLLARRNLEEPPNNLFQAFSPGNIIYLDDETPDRGQSPGINPEIPGSRPACILYTSGTTGLPRGVVLEHQNITHQIPGLNDVIYKKYTGPLTLHVALVTLFMSGLSLKQISGALLTGQTLHIYPDSGNPSGDTLYEFYRRHQIDISDATPTHIRLLSESAGEKPSASTLPVKHFLLGGERQSTKILNAFFNRFTPNGPRVTHIYGCAEAGDISLWYHQVQENRGSYHHLPIGKPFPGIYADVLGKENQVQPPGVPGELVIGGPGLARGYFNDPGLTGEKFCLRQPGALFGKTAPGPRKNFLLNQSPLTNHHSPIYHTGDLARRLPDGNLEFLGRNDETGEIEYHLQTHPDINECCVTTSGDKGEIGGLTVLFTAQKEVAAVDLQSYLAQRLPTGQTPGQFTRVTQLPHTANFKIDRKQWQGYRPDPAKVIIAPRHRVERQLLRLWSELLEIEETGISIDANFLELNGNSLKTIMLISRIFKEFDVQVPLAEVFKTPTIIGLSQYIQHAVKGKFIPRQPAEKKEYYPLSSTQQRLYFVQQLDPSSTAYNIFQVEFLRDSLEKNRLENVFRQLIHRHQVLRTSFPLVDNKPVQRVHREIDFALEFFPSAPGAVTAGNQAVVDRMIRDFVKPFNLARPPLFRVSILPTVEKEQFLVIDMHHIISDALSMQILIRDFRMLYEGRQLKPLILQYRDYSQWQQGKEMQETMEKQRKFWLNEFAGELPETNLPYDFAKPAIQNFAGEKLRFKIDKENTSILKALALEEDLTAFILFLAIYYIFLSKITGQADIVVGTGTAGRVHADLEDIVGMFISLLALRNTPAGEKTYIEFLREVKTRTIAAFENQEYPYEELIAEIAANTGKNPQQLFAVGYTFLFREIPGSEPGQQDAKLVNYESETSKLDLTLTGQEVGDEIHFTFEYCTALFKPSKIRRFAGYFQEIVSAVARSREIRLQDLRISHGYTDLKTNISGKIQGDFGF